jgi:hypothetical protein
VICLIHDQPQISGAEYTDCAFFHYDDASHTPFDWSVTVDKNLFSSGTSLHMALFPSSGYFGFYRDIYTNQNVFTDLGEPSEVVNLVVPD